MKFLVLFVLIGVVACETNKLQGKFVWDLLKPALNAAEVSILMGSRAAEYPTYNTIPNTGFSCASKAQPGFYADEETQCQVFHRCDQGLNQTSYLCVNQTIFNQVTLVCDSWYNVDCARSKEVENFANARLYTDLPLFDTPPAEYISPSQLILMQNQGVSQPGSISSSSGSSISSGSSTSTSNSSASSSTGVNSIAGGSTTVQSRPQPTKVPGSVRGLRSH